MSKEYKKNKKKEARHRNYKFIGNIKDKSECLICFDKQKLTFHHRDPKKKKNNVQRLASMGLSLSAIKAEIEKCDLLCEECHRLVHKIGLKKYKKFKDYIKDK